MKHLKLLSSNKKLASEFHPTKNAPLTPADFTLGSNQAVYWLCKKNKDHSWKVSVNDRYQYKTGCPYCSGKKVDVSNCLSTTHPVLAEEWHPTKNKLYSPEKMSRGSHIKVWWLCKNDRTHEWLATINSRTNIRGSGRATGCPFCNSKTSMLELRIFTELKRVFHPIEQRKRISSIECDIFIPKIRVAIEVDGSFWHLEKLDADRAKNKKLEKLGIKTIRVRGEGLAKISRLDLIHSFNAPPLNVIKAILRSIIKIRDVDRMTTNKISKYLKTKKFRNNSEYKELLNMLPWALPGKRLSEIRPDIAEEWHPTKNGTLTPDMVSIGSNQSVYWLCKYDQTHEWEARIFCRTHRGRESGCPYCSGRKPSINYNLSVTHPDLAKQWHPVKNRPWTPEMVTRGSHKIIYWVCKKNNTHIWPATVNKRTLKRECPYCTNRIACKENCLATVYPGIAEEWHPTKNRPYTPYDVTFGSGMNVWWQCPVYKSHTWYVSVNDRTAYKTGCPKCLRKKANSRNCLATINPSLAKKWHPIKNGNLTPKDITTQSIKKVYWLCCENVNHDWKATVNQRKWNDVCPICQKIKKKDKELPTE